MSVSIFTLACAPSVSLRSRASGLSPSSFQLLPAVITVKIVLEPLAVTITFENPGSQNLILILACFS